MRNRNTEMTPADHGARAAMKDVAEARDADHFAAEAASTRIATDEILDRACGTSALYERCSGRDAFIDRDAEDGIARFESAMRWARACRAAHQLGRHYHADGRDAR